MRIQISIDILFSMSVSMAIAGFGYVLYAHSGQASGAAIASIAGYAKASEYYQSALSNFCRCLG
ncbi:MAG: hypothetical protein ACYCO0_03140 [Candidatus Micrarchaeaceae archaeon]